MPLKTLKKPGRIPWYIRGTVAGQRYDESTGTTDYALAEQMRVRRENELLTESIHGKAATATFSQAVLHYIQHGGEKRFLEPLLLHFKAALLSTIGQGQIDDAALKLYPRMSAATWTRQVYTPMSSVLHHAASLGWCQEPKIKRPKAASGRERWLTKDEVERLLAACSPHLRRILIFLFYTGARIGEALWLDWRNVDLERKHVQFIDTKNGTSRGVPLHDRVVQMLRGVNNRTGCVFLADHGGEYARPKKGASADTSAGTRIKTAFKAACRRAGITNFRPHDCRHTWATWHYIANRDLGALMRLGGWKTMQMVMRYAHTNVDELAATIGRL